MEVLAIFTNFANQFSNIGKIVKQNSFSTMTKNRLFTLLLAVFLMAGTATAQGNDRNATVNVAFDKLTYSPREEKATVGSVLGAIADAMANKTTQEHSGQVEALRAALVRGMSQARRVSLTDGPGTQQPEWYVDGTVSNISTTTKVEETKDSKGKVHKTTYYKALVGVTLQVKDAQTESIIASPAFNVYAEDVAWLESREGAISNAFSYMATRVTKYFNKQLPLYANIIEGARDKKDKQKEVYIDLGEATKGVAKGLHFGVYRLKTVAGKEARKLIGKIKVSAVEGDEVSLCKVQSGGKDIKAAIDGGETILVVSLD